MILQTWHVSLSKQCVVNEYIKIFIHQFDDITEPKHSLRCARLSAWHRRQTTMCVCSTPWWVSIKRADQKDFRTGFFVNWGSAVRLVQLNQPQTIRMFFLPGLASETWHRRELEHNVCTRPPCDESWRTQPSCELSYIFISFTNLQL